MKSIKSNVYNIYTINKSKFICYLIKIDNLDDIGINLNKIKNEYKDATHYCYAYILDNKKKFSDDKEPSGTAGLPILNVLENNELNHILCVVVRYFGGIKLGAGGLLRAYTKSVTEALNNTTINELQEGLEVTIEFGYDENKKIDNLLKNYNIIKKEFNDKIIYTFEISNDDFNKIKQDLSIINKQKKFLII